MKQFIISCLCILVLLGTSCSRNIANETGPAHIDAEVVYRGVQCNGPAKGPSAEWVLDPGHLSIIYSRLHRHIISPAGITLPEVDFSEAVLLLIEMGYMPSAGYGVDLAVETVSIDNGTAELNILWTEPARKDLQAQVITSPCVMIKLPKTGYTAVSITDQNSRVLLKHALSVK